MSPTQRVKPKFNLLGSSRWTACLRWLFVACLHDKLADRLTPTRTPGYIPREALGEATLLRNVYFIFAFVAIAALAGNLIATVAILRSDFYSPLQRRLQLALVWLIPVIGAACCMSFASLHRRPILRPDKSFPGPDSFQLPGGEANGS